MYDQARTVTNAVAVNEGRYPDVAPILGAIPLTNSFQLFPGARENGTTALTYLLVDPTASVGRQRRAAQRYADRYFGPRDNTVGVTGSVPARAEQGDIISEKLPTVELWTMIAILAIVSIAFRSLVAPVLTLFVAGVGYLMTLSLASIADRFLGLSTPAELRPVVVAMLLGVSTDYVVFLMSSLREERARIDDPRDAVEGATARSAHIVATAGLAVALGSGVLAVAASQFFRALAPPLVLTVIVALLVCLTLLPALLAVTARAAFWPGAQPRVPVGQGRPRVLEGIIARIAADRQVAGMVVLGCVLALVAAATPVSRMDLGVSFVASLPQDTAVRRAATQAQLGFADGILSPTILLVEGDGLARQGKALRTLGDELRAEPGVAGVLGPADLPVSRRYNVFLAPNGGAVRYLIVFSDQPLGAAAIGHVDELRGRLPAILRTSGLEGVRDEGLGGDTEAASFIVHSTEADLARIALAALLINFLLLLVFLRGAVAATYLLSASVLSVAATLGITTSVFESVAPGQGLTFYVPFAAAVLLLAFGSDYNVFSVGKIWDQVPEREVPEVLVTVSPPTTRALAAAGSALGASFGVLAIVPLLPFRQLAFAMAVGLFIDVFVVRALLVPSLIRVFGDLSFWPIRTRRIGPDREDSSFGGLPAPIELEKPRREGAASS
ncbi:MMPL family transporter [Nocardioides sp.]|uniref:MMPL family transporter n=1 Tax=Nocardioides sp. TaxID=35761 RepID=UPI0035282028